LTYEIEGRKGQVLRHVSNQLVSVQSSVAPQEIGAKANVFFQELLPLTGDFRGTIIALNLRVVSGDPLQFRSFP
jgi:hypothetical protein